MISATPGIALIYYDIVMSDWDMYISSGLCLDLESARLDAPDFPAEQEHTMKPCIAFCAFFTCVVALGAQAASACTEIRFAPGMTSTEITDDAPPDDVICFTIRTSAGQNAEIRVLDGSNTIATVLGVPGAEARQDISFTTLSTEYEIHVGQLMRAVDPQSFRLLVSVE